MAGRPEPLRSPATGCYFVYVAADGSNTEHIQICEVGGLQELRHLAVRNYLRVHRDECAAYAAVERAAAQSARGSRDTYSAAKNNFVQALEQRALAWVQDGAPSPKK